jgi:hypothetical protein
MFARAESYYPALEIRRLPLLDKRAIPRLDCCDDVNVNGILLLAGCDAVAESEKWDAHAVCESSTRRERLVGQTGKGVGNRA